MHIPPVVVAIIVDMDAGWDAIHPYLPVPIMFCYYRAAPARPRMLPPPLAAWFLSGLAQTDAVDMMPLFLCIDTLLRGTV